MKGLKYCNGDIILFLDSDDFFKNSKIKEVVKFFKKIIKQKFLLIYPIIITTKNLKIKNKINNSKNLILAIFFFSKLYISKKKLSKKKLLNQYPLKNILISGLIFRLISKSFYDFGKINHINKHLTYYQQNLGSVSQKIF